LPKQPHHSLYEPSTMYLIFFTRCQTRRSSREATRWDHAWCAMTRWYVFLMALCLA